MNSNQELSAAFRVARGLSGQWEVIEDSLGVAVARFQAPQAALSYACELAETRKGSLVVVFDTPRRRAAKAFAGLVGANSASVAGLAN